MAITFAFGLMIGLKSLCICTTAQIAQPIELVINYPGLGKIFSKCIIDQI